MSTGAGQTGSAALEAFAQRREVIAGDIAKLEKQIYELESIYFTADCTNFGNVVKGFSEFLTSKSAQAKNKNRQFRLEDRVFSLSSITSPGCAAALLGMQLGIALAPGVHTQLDAVVHGKSGPCVATTLCRPISRPQTQEAQNTPTDAGPYLAGGAAPLPARAVAQAPPPKRRY